MRFDRLTIKSQEAVQAAQDFASRSGSPDVDVEHLLLALIDQQEGVVTPILQKIGAEVQAIRSEVEEGVRRGTKVQGDNQELRVSSALREAFDRSWKEATNLKDEYVSTAPHIESAKPWRGRLHVVPVPPQSSTLRSAPSSRERAEYPLFHSASSL